MRHAAFAGIHQGMWHILAGMTRLVLVAVTVLAVGCRREATPSVDKGSAAAAPAPAVAPPTGPVAGPEPKPKAKEPEPDLPDAATTKALADKACPRVVAPYFFAIEKAGKVGHILGTRHLSVGLAKMPAMVRTKLLAAKLVMFETPPGDEGGEMPAPGKPLSELLGAKLWDKYKHLVGDDNAAQVDAMPIAVAMISMLMLYEDQSAKLDGEIEELVKTASIETGGLESSAFQDKLLGELLDLRMLKAAIGGTPDRGALLHEAIDDIAEYCAGTDDTPGMDDRSRKQLKDGGYTDAEIATLDLKLLDQRNNAWMPKLETLFAKDGVFVVVGADHLTGPRGVIAQLAARGFTTTRLKP
jgi:uncharacterized protein YbaP (TraB family)